MDLPMDSIELQTAQPAARHASEAPRRTLRERVGISMRRIADA
jgi:hypothetical protein